MDLFRIASGGNGLLKEGEIDPDLVKRLASEAAKSARHVLRICIRAMDYIPPVSIEFGDYLRAIITADHDLYAADDNGCPPRVLMTRRARCYCAATASGVRSPAM